MSRAWLILAGVILSGCMTLEQPPTPAPVDAGPRVSKAVAARNFLTVLRRVEPVAEAECRAQLASRNCDFNIVVDERAGQPANAYQTLDKAGRPVIAFTTALLAEARNQDELAFIMGHEAAHHIRGHIPKTQQGAVAGAVVGGLLAKALGAGSATIEQAQRLGGAVGARGYSKKYELQADQLGTIIAVRAGYDPVRGAAFFTRIPDPGNRFLGSHPPNADRIETVKRTVANM